MSLLSLPPFGKNRPALAAQATPFGKTRPALAAQVTPCGKTRRALAAQATPFGKTRRASFSAAAASTTGAVLCVSPSLSRFSIVALLAICTLGFLSSCSDVDKIEHRNEAGVVVQRFYRSKVDSLVQGKFEIFDDAGRLVEEAYYDKGLLEGQRTLYHPNGNPQYVETHTNGVFEGPYKAYYPDGQLELEGIYVNNEMTGIWKRYYPDGSKREEVTFAEGKENGPFQEWYPSGKQKAQGQYADGPKEDGELLMYDEDGQLERKMRCDTGICRTFWTPDSLNVSAGG